MRTDGGEILLRTIGQAYRGAEFEDMVLWTRADGSRLRLGDVATVVDGFSSSPVAASCAVMTQPCGPPRGSQLRPEYTLPLATIGLEVWLAGFTV